MTIKNVNDNLGVLTWKIGVFWPSYGSTNFVELYISNSASKVNPWTHDWNSHLLKRASKKSGSMTYGTVECFQKYNTVAPKDHRIIRLVEEILHQLIW